MASTTREKHKTFFIFFGPPGSGKDTQAEKLAAELKLGIFNPGELFRHEIKAGTTLGREIKPIVASGRLVKDKIINGLVDKVLASDEFRAGAVFDGYPRTLTQTRFLQGRLDRIVDKTHKIYAILIDISDDEVRKRLANRRVCKCGENFHLFFKPPRQAGICDRCGRKLLMRNDDRPEVIANRLALYHRHTGPMMGFFREKHELIKVDGEKSIEEVSGEIKKLLKRHGI
jgi:adenylate kinase